MDVGLIRKVASSELGRRALDALTGTPDDSVDSIFLHKTAQVEDPELLRTAAWMGGDALRNYENLGGKYKTAEKDMPPFLEQDRPKKVKEIYSAIKREHPEMPSGMKARIASSKGISKKAEEEKAPISYRAGSAIGRNMDSVSGLAGTVPGLLAGFHAADRVEHPAGAVLIPAGALAGFLGARGMVRFGQGLTSGAAHAYGDTSAKQNSSPVEPRQGVNEPGEVQAWEKGASWEKQAFGQPMFSASAAPHPMTSMSQGIKSPSSSSGPRVSAPSVGGGSSGAGASTSSVSSGMGGGSSQGSVTTSPIQTPSVSNATDSGGQ